MPQGLDKALFPNAPSPARPARHPEAGKSGRAEPFRLTAEPDGRVERSHAAPPRRGSTGAASRRETSASQDEARQTERPRRADRDASARPPRSEAPARTTTGRLDHASRSEAEAAHRDTPTECQEARKALKPMAAEASEAGDASEAVGAREDAVDEGKTAADAASLGATNIAGVPVEPDPDSLSKGDPDGAKAASTHDADTPGPCGNGLSPAAPAFAAPPSVPVPQTGVAGPATDLAASAAKNVGATLPATAQGRPVEAGTGPAPEAEEQGDAELNPARAPHKAPFEPAPAGSDQAGIADRIDLSPAANQDGARPPPGPLQGPDPGAAAPKAAAAVPAPPAHLPIVHQVPIGAVPVEIGLKSLAGTNRFEIRLDPEELGRIDVRLDIDESGGVKAHLVVDRVETLALLQRDAKTLERAFEQAGLKPSEGGVDLSLRDPSSDGRQNGESREERPRPGPGAREDAAAAARPEAPALRPVYRAWRGSAGIDLRI